jgi:hypothetical protein
MRFQWARYTVVQYEFVDRVLVIVTGYVEIYILIILTLCACNNQNVF